MTTNYLKKIRVLWSNPGGQRGRCRPESGWTDRVKEEARKLVEIGGRMPMIEDAGDICLRRIRPTQCCIADDDDDDA
jgi:hypothetical protein